MCALVTGVQTCALPICLMTDARSWALNGNYHAATVGRDGLIIALLICCPVRIANLTAIEIGNHLVAADDGYVLTFRSEETKNGDEINLELPDRKSKRLNSSH